MNTVHLRRAYFHVEAVGTLSKQTSPFRPSEAQKITFVQINDTLQSSYPGVCFGLCSLSLLNFFLLIYLQKQDLKYPSI